MRVPSTAGSRCIAVAYFTVMDAVSNSGMAVVVDKWLKDRPNSNSEPQLITALIALYQANDFSLEQRGSITTTISATLRPPVVGVLVNGLHFWFYQLKLKSLAWYSAMSSAISCGSLFLSFNHLSKTTAIPEFDTASITVKSATAMHLLPAVDGTLMVAVL